MARPAVVRRRLPPSELAPSAPSAPAFLRLEGITKRFGARTALDELSLTVARGEVLGLLGPNGAGKSTLVACLVGLLRPEAGRVTLEGGPLVGAARARVGVAPQELGLYPDLTGEENLRFFARLYGLAGSLLSRRVSAALDFVGLWDRRGDRVGTWSGGMQRRLNLAVAVVHDPDLIVLDEPTVGVDPQSRNRLLDNVEALRSQGKAVIYTTHYMEEAERLCDRVAVVDAGRLLAIGRVDELVARHGGRAVIVAERPGGAELRLESDDPLVTLAGLREQGALRSFRVEAPNLERVFLELTGRGLRD